MNQIMIIFLILKLTSMQYRFNTPQRSTLNRINIENQPSGRQYYQSHQSNRYDSVIDYKAKAFELMQTVTELQIKEKQSQRTIFYLQRQLEVIQKNLDQFLSEFGVSSLSDLKSQYLHLVDQMEHMKKQNEKPLVKEQKITTQYEKILGQYKTIIKYQQEKMLKYQNKWKAQEKNLEEKCSNLSKKQQILSQELQQMRLNNQNQKETIIQKHKSQIQKLQCQISQLKSELSLQNNQEDLKAQQSSKKLLAQNIEMKQELEMLKSQFRDLLIQKQSIEEKHEKLKKKYKNEIEHFEMIQKQVEEKLIQVQKQISFYKEQRQSNLQLIQKLQYENQILQYNPKQLQEQFSFGGYFNVQTQTQPSGLQSEILMNSECYEISIKSLLQENTRLKRTLVLLDKTKRGQEIPPEAQLELKLLRGLAETPHLKSKRAEKDSQESPKFRVLEGLQKDSEHQNNTE